MKLILSILFCFSWTIVLAQQINIDGTVVDETYEEPLLLVNVTNNYEEKTTKTDFDGKFSLSVKRNDTLTFSLKGFETKKISVIDILSNELIISLKEHPDDLILEGFEEKREWCCPTIIKPDQIVYNGKPKNFFKENKKKKLFIIFVKELNPSFKTKNDSIYELKFNVVYYRKDVGWNDKFVSEYNEMTYDFLMKKYNKLWLSDVRKDAVGIEKHLK